MYANDNMQSIIASSGSYAEDKSLCKSDQEVAKKENCSLDFDDCELIEFKDKGRVTCKGCLDVINKIKMFARINNVHIFIVAHTKKVKQKEDGSYFKPKLYDIAGSANFFNFTDNGIIIYKNPEEGSYYDNEIIFEKIKYKWVGKKGSYKYKYVPSNNRYFPIETPEKDLYEPFINLNEKAPF